LPFEVGVLLAATLRIEAPSPRLMCPVSGQFVGSVCGTIISRTEPPEKAKNYHVLGMESLMDDRIDLHPETVYYPNRIYSVCHLFLIEDPSL
jgi:hypothetical protein